MERQTLKAHTLDLVFLLVGSITLTFHQKYRFICNFFFKSLYLKDWNKKVWASDNSKENCKEEDSTKKF